MSESDAYWVMVLYLGLVLASVSFAAWWVFRAEKKSLIERTEYEERYNIHFKKQGDDS